MSKLTERMKKEVEKTCEAYQTDLVIDKELLSDDFRPLKSYIWIVKKAGTELMPENLTLCRDEYYNSLAHGCAERSENKAFRIELTSRGVGIEEIEGKITKISDLKAYLDKNAITPDTIRYKYLLSDGKSGEVTVPYGKYHFESLLDSLQVRREDVVKSCVLEVF